METAKEHAGLLKQTFSEFLDDDCMSMAAALAYYTIFSLPPLLVIVITVAGLVLDPQEVQVWIETQASSLIDPEVASQIEGMTQGASERVEGGFSLGLILSIGAILFGATGAFAQLQAALNAAWNVEADPEGGGVVRYVIKRILSLGMIVLIAVLLLTAVIISSLLSALQGQITEILATVGAGGLSGELLWVANLVVFLLIVSQLFAIMFKVLPDVRVAWRDVQVGAGVTALLFMIGTFLISYYIGQSSLGEAYGAAAALAVLLVWVYYSTVIVLFGAEFTQVWARRHGGGIEPDENAVRVGDRDRLVRQPG